MKRKLIKLISWILIITIFMIIIGNTNQIYAATTYYQYVKTGINEFPTSYQERLKELANKYPSWKFQAYYTGISWNELIEKERDESIHRNRVTSTAPLSWKHCDFVDDGWACASDAAVKYYLDPRNFLNETQIFQFVETSYNADVQTLSAIQNSVKGTFLDNTITCKDLNDNTVTMSYSQIIIEAAKKTNISAFYIKSKIIQEVGTSGSGSVTGTYPGYEGYYNFFNYGAYDDGNDIANGLQYAKNKGWNSQYKAIVGGAELIGKYYINQGQNTAYFNKWDVVGTKILRSGESQTVSSSDMFWHQYMTNIQDPTSQSYSNKKLYANSLNSEITFIIPVYENMPSSNPMPEDVKLQSISLYTTQLNLQVGQEATVTKGYIGAAYNPSNVTDKVLYWSSSNENVAKVSEGNVTAVGEGTATITAKSRDGGKTATCTVTVTKIDKALKSITTKESLELEVGKEGWLGVTYNPTNASDKVLYWTSSNPKVATVNEGVIKALSTGTTTLTATSRDGGKTATCKVTVHENIISLESLSLKTTNLVIEKGKTSTIYATYNPSNVTDKVLYWKSSNENVAKVSAGNVTAIGKGTATITATSRDGGKTATCKVTVSENGIVPLESISLKTTNLEMEKGDSSIIYVTYNPSSMIDKVIYWKSSNESVAKVSEGKVTAVGKGTATITATSRDGGKTATCKVTVTEKGIIPLESITLKTNKLVLEKGKNSTIYVTYNPSNVTDKVLYWKSSNENVAKVSEGNVTAVGTGVATLTVTSKDGGKTATCKVIVVNPNTEMKNITLKTTEQTMTKGATSHIYATYNPSNVTDKVLYWISSNENIVKVSEGNVTAVGTGTATLTAISRDGGKTAECTINVTN